jgi:hypothetical protein
LGIVPEFIIFLKDRFEDCNKRLEGERIARNLEIEKVSNKSDDDIKKMHSKI